MAAAPDIDAVVGHIKRQIAHQSQTTGPGLPLQLGPLLAQLPLQQGLRQQLRAVLGRELAQGPTLALGQGTGPLPPGLALVQTPQHHEAAVILQPEGLGAPPGSKSLLTLLGLLAPMPAQGLRHGGGPGGGRGGVEAIQAASGQASVISGVDQAGGQ